MTDTTTSDAETGRTATQRVLDAVARAEGTGPLELDRLSDAVDPDALNALFRDGGFDGTVEFDYLGYRVRVRDDGGVAVDPA